MTRITAAAIAALWATAIPAPTVAQTNDVTVIRGSGTSSAADRTVAGVEVVHGTPVAASQTPSPGTDTETSAYGTAGQQALAPQPFAAGDTLWFRKAGTDRLTACWVGGSGYVGVSVIRCTDRRAY